jgi:hypothetical protein
MRDLYRDMRAVLEEAGEESTREAARVRRAVLAARECHWSNAETMRLLAEVRQHNEAALQAVGVDLAKLEER